ncbi:hypothetical protein BDV27DRAFT_132031 [Aspergillus caelatus]|uniref:Uncharacterized protein n=1 Tax=Aspergillus caelatus TaxID=61420 RepID=A0A5N6ZXT2_9EURO|nr:uncharacterized protein BDV27DRAFT_132031 [Aspergillus caelatus]KAE8362093.1 hypothetical protein BDV27DRAFT_132031 [Aspergillus caelatus]
MSRRKICLSAIAVSFVERQRGLDGANTAQPMYAVDKPDQGPLPVPSIHILQGEQAAQAFPEFCSGVDSSAEKAAHRRRQYLHCLRINIFISRVLDTLHVVYDGNHSPLSCCLSNIYEIYILTRTITRTGIWYFHFDSAPWI